MPKIKFNSIIADARGSLGEVIFDCTSGGKPYIRTRRRNKSNPHSPAQTDIRIVVATASKDWYDTLTETERNLWNTYANY